MADTRQKRHSAAFKAKVALEAIKQTRNPGRAGAGLLRPPGTDQPVEEAAPGRRRVALRRGRRREQAPSRTLSSAPKSAGALQDGQSLKAGPAWLDPTSSRFSR